MLFISSSSVYGIVPEEKQPLKESVAYHPQEPYSASKVAAELYLLVKNKAEEFGVPLDWALGRRKEFLYNLIKREKNTIINIKTRKVGIDLFYDRLLELREKTSLKLIKSIKFQLKILSPYWQTKKNNITDEMIENARQYPIKSLMKNSVRNDMTLCPFHDDSNPSMSIKKNTAYCFACNKKWNSIDFVMDIKNYDFKEAVKYLNEI